MIETFLGLCVFLTTPHFFLHFSVMNALGQCWVKQELPWMIDFHFLSASLPVFIVGTSLVLVRYFCFILQQQNEVSLFFVVLSSALEFYLWPFYNVRGKTLQLL